MLSHLSTTLLRYCEHIRLSLSSGAMPLASVVIHARRFRARVALEYCSCKFRGGVSESLSELTVSDEVSGKAVDDSVGHDDTEVTRKESGKDDGGDVSDDGEPEGVDEAVVDCVGAQEAI